MKTRNLLIAALLLGGMTAFNSCSEKTEVDEIIPPIDNPAEELDTYLAFTAGFGDKLMTRAEGESGATVKDFDKVMNYGEFIFEVNESGNPGKYLAHYINPGTEGGDPIFSSNSEGFNLQPLKFKTAKEQIAIVVVANSNKLLESSTTTITDFDTFSKLFNEVTLPANDEVFAEYPMSSNVLICNIVPGKYNSVGFGENQAAIDAFESYGITEVTKDNLNISNENNINLYRCWSIVKLNKVTVGTYSDGAKNAKFDFEEAFVMNVPSMTNLFNTTLTNKINAWGGDLNVDLQSYLDGDNGFYSGYKDDDTDDKQSSDDSGDAYDEGYRSEAIANLTSYYKKYNNTLADAQSVVKSNVGTFTNTELDYSKEETFKYIVAPSTYGKDSDTGDQISNQSIVLVLKGKYSQLFENGGAWYGTGDGGDIVSSYYTVVINNEDDVQSSSLENIPNTVMRNVQYEIDMLVKGPGSPTPVNHLANTYLVNKVKIVAFGKVTQSSSKD